MYDGGSDSDGDGSVEDGGVGCDIWAKRTNPVLDLASNSYSELKISVGDSGPSSCPTYTVVATTRCNGTRSMLTSAKLTEGYLVVGIYKRTR